MSEDFNPDWACKPDCIASEVLKERLQTALQPPSPDTAAALEALDSIKSRMANLMKCDYDSSDFLIIERFIKNVQSK